MTEKDVQSLHRLFGGDLSLGDMEILLTLIGGRCSANEAAERIYELMGLKGVEDASGLLAVMRREEEETLNKTRQTQDKADGGNVVEEDLVHLARAWGFQDKKNNQTNNPENFDGGGDGGGWLPVKGKGRNSNNNKSHSPPVEEVVFEMPPLMREVKNPGNLKVVRVPPWTSLDVAKENLKLVTSSSAKGLLSEIYTGQHPRLLIIMRGVPGSGKSTLARAFYSVSAGPAVICSADNYFTRPNGKYVFDGSELGKAHRSCQSECEKAMKEGKALVIVDNTNTTRNEVDVYVKLGVKFNYDIHVQEPVTEWNKDARELVHKTVHGVPREAIMNMLRRYEQLSIEFLIKEIVEKTGNASYKPPGTLNAAIVASARRNQEARKKKLLDRRGKEEMTLSNVPSKPLVNLSDYVVKATSTSSSAISAIAAASGTTNKGILHNLSSWRSGFKIVNEVSKVTSSSSNESMKVMCSKGRSRMCAVFPSTSDNVSETKTEIPVSLCETGLCSSPSPTQRRRATSTWCEVPRVETAVEVMSPEDYPVLPPPSPSAAGGDRDGFSEEELFLLNSFPECGEEELLHFFRLCQSDLNDTISLLLDSGYEMADDPSKQRPSLTGVKFVDQNSISGGAASGSVSPTRGGPNNKTFGPVYSVMDVNHNEPSTSNLRDVPPRMKSPKLKAPKLKVHKQRKEMMANEENVIVDGGDWVDLKISDEFLDTLYSMYGEIDGHRVNELKGSDKTIRIPPELAFSLYGYVYLNVHRRQKQELIQEEEESNNDEQFPLHNDNNSNNDGGRASTSPPQQTMMSPEELEGILKEYKRVESTRCVLDSVPLSVDEHIAVETNNAQIDEEKERLRNGIPRTLAFVIRLNDLKKRFPTLSEGVLDDALVSEDFNYSAAVERLKASAPHKYVEEKAEEERDGVVPNNTSVMGVGRNNYNSNREESWWRVEDEEYDPDKVAAMSESQLAEVKADAQYWQEQTDALSRKMDGFRDRATNQRGIGGARDYYTNEANSLRPHVNAAQQCYAYYHLLSLNGRGDSSKIDLHGQPVKHGVKYALKYLQNRQNWVNEHLPPGRQLDVKIITGWGKHSRDNIPRLRLQVMGALSKHHYSYYIKSPGEILVHLRPQ